MIDLNSVEEAMGIAMVHNSNIVVEGITFQNMNSGHYLEVDGVQNLTVRNNKFLDGKPTIGNNKEAINIDGADSETGGCRFPWSSFDKTMNSTVLIEKNYFKGTDRAIGTHKYSNKEDKKGNYTIPCYHEKITIRDNIFEDLYSAGIWMMNWKDCTIENNLFKRKTRSFVGISFSGANNITVLNNTFSDITAYQFKDPESNSGPGGIYGSIFNNLSEENKNNMKNNNTIR